MQALHSFAPAKINVFLRITGLRSDGYHLLDSLMIPITLCDELDIEVKDEKRSIGDQRREPSTEKLGEKSSKPKIILTCDDPDIPSDETNLAHKAATLLLQAAGVQATISIRLQKHIPAGAGLGGGSSDAAAILKGLNTLLELGFAEDQLCQLGARLGADVPFFIPCRPAHVEGVGEILTSTPPLPHRWLVLVVPPFGVSTPWAYQQFDKLSPTKNHTNLHARTFDQWPPTELFVNDLERAVFPAYPRIAELKSAMLHLAAEGALMSGSGSSVFGIFQNRAQAEKAAVILERQGKTFLVEPFIESSRSL